jgi:hypothetical protein
LSVSRAFESEAKCRSYKTGANKTELVLMPEMNCSVPVMEI